MTKKVLIPDAVPAMGEQIIIDAGYEIINGSGRQSNQMMQEGHEASAVLIGTQPFTAEIMDAMPQLEVIARNGVGYDAVDVEEAHERGIKVVNTPTALTDAVAENTVAELLGIAKNLYWNSKSIYDGEWKYKKAHLGRDLSGKTIGILGFGRIGQAVAKKLQGFNVRLIAVDPKAQGNDDVSMVERDQLFEESDYILVHLPAMPATQHSIGAREFQMMKNDAVLINMARGSILVEDELVEALQQGIIGGAALDVFEEEPLPKDHPLTQFENVLLTPHIASNTVETKQRMAVDAAHDIVAVLSGNQPKFLVK